MKEKKLMVEIYHKDIKCPIAIDMLKKKTNLDTGEKAYILVCKNYLTGYKFSKLKIDFMNLYFVIKETSE